MRIKSASYIYGILILGSGYGLLSTLFSYYFSFKKQSDISISKAVLPKNFILTDDKISVIYSRNIFNIDGTIPTEGQIMSRASRCPGVANASALPYDIVGILYGGRSENSVALLEDRKTKNVLILKHGSALPEKGIVSSIDSNRVWIVTNICPEYIESPKTKLPSPRIRRGVISQKAGSQTYSEPGFDRNGTNTNVTKEWVDDILTNKLGTVLGDALATPHMTNGQIDGFEISQIEPMSVYDKLGLKDGDIVTTINGVPLNDVGRAIRTLNTLKTERQIELQVMRNGQPTTFHLNVQ